MKKLSAREKRCEDCICCVSKNGKMICDELWDRPCADIGEDECPEDVTIKQVEEMEEKGKSVKIKLNAHSENIADKKKTARTPKVDEEKEKIIVDLAIFAENFAENVQITNKSKVIEFNIGENHYKLDLIKQRKPKN